MKQFVMLVGLCVLFAAVAGARTASKNTLATGKGPAVIYPIEHATFVMQWNGKTIAVDPIGGGTPLMDLGPADLILITDIN